MRLSLSTTAGGERGEELNGQRCAGIPAPAGWMDGRVARWDEITDYSGRAGAAQALTHREWRSLPPIRWDGGFHREGRPADYSKISNQFGFNL